jgi:hypothetical protein
MLTVSFQGHHKEIVPDLQDDDVETFKDNGDDDDHWDM